MLAMAGARPFRCLGALILGQVVDGLRWQNRHGSNIGEYTQHIVEHEQHCSICVQENGYRVLKKNNSVQCTLRVAAAVVLVLVPVLEAVPAVPSG